MASLYTKVTSIGSLALGMVTPGGRFRFTTTEVRGFPVRTFVNLAPALRDVYLPYFAMHKDKTWLVYENERYTFAQALVIIEALVRELVHGFGIKPGDKVGLAMRNYPEFLLIFLAIQMAGAVVVPLNSLWKTEELEYAIKDSACKLILADPERLRRLLPLVEPLGLTTVLCRPEADEGKPVPPAHHFYAKVVASGKTRLPVSFTRDPEDEAMLMYTSGTTGFPKGVMHTQRSVGTIIRLCELGALAMPGSGEGVLLLPVPLFHITGVAGVFLRSICTGSTIVLMRKWDAGTALDLIEREGVTGMTGVPTMIRDMMEHPTFTQKRVRSLKNMSAAGAPVPPTQVAKLKKKAKKVESGQAYGLTEVIAATVISGAEYAAHPKSCGKPTLFVDVKIKDPVTGKEVPTNERGEVCIRSAMLMKGYHNLPDKTAAVMDKEGFFRSGDIGRLDSQGYLYIMDRLKDLIIRGGENIDCSEVEAAICTHPAVRECSVFGLPDERLGEVVGAAIWVTEEGVTAEEVCAAAMKVVTKFKVPAAENLFFHTEELPKGGTGKLDKKGLRATYSAIVEQRPIISKL